MTWPLPLKLTTSVPGDYGDPLFVSWVMSYVARQLSAAIVNPFVLRTFWDAPIFFPEPGTLALSEHFIPQTLLVLPIYWLRGGQILCYNLAFLSSFVLTAMATALLARALTGSILAGLLAGVVAAFNEFRLVWEVARLQTLSIYWFPLVLFGIHRYVATGQRRVLAGTVIAWVALNLSSIYYFAFCQPFIAAFALAELARLGRLRVWRLWLDLTAAATIVALLTVPFLMPYAQMQQRLGFERTLQEVITLSATLDDYHRALPKLLVPVLLSVLAVAAAISRIALRRRVAVPSSISPALVALILTLLILSLWLSLGPVVRAGGRVLDVPGLYPVLAMLPGYGGLRVPTRFIALFFVFLGLLAGLGVSAISRVWPRAGFLIATCAMCAFLWQGRDQRVTLDRPLPSPGLAEVPSYLTPARTLPPIYRAVAKLPPSAVLVELPFGDPWYDVRYMFFAATHLRTLINGYSGVFPPSHLVRQAALADPLKDPIRARSALTGATHVVVHKAAWTTAHGTEIDAWLQEHGALVMGEVDGASLYQLPPEVLVDDNARQRGTR